MPQFDGDPHARQAAEEVVEPLVVAFLSWVQLHQHRPVMTTKVIPRPDDPLDPLFGRTKAPRVRQPRAAFTDIVKPAGRRSRHRSNMASLGQR
jgi:hypothetical protein